MRILIDSNILFPLDPLGPTYIEPRQQLPAMELMRIAGEARATIVLHPCVNHDLQRDSDAARRSYRVHLLQKYQMLESPPAITPDLETILGHSEVGSNDWVDNNLLAAVARDAVDILVTEDRGIHRKATKLDIADRVLLIDTTIEVLRAKIDQCLPAPPAVKQVRFHDLDERLPFFDSFREDYEEFDSWFIKCKRMGRKAWVVKTGDELAAFCAVKTEEDRPYGLNGRVLKICSFKVGPEHSRARYGETLLRAVFAHAFANKADHIYATAFSKQKLLSNFFAEFGFHGAEEATARGEHIYTKRLCPTPVDEDELDAIQFATQFGPCLVSWRAASVWAVPIQPKFDRMLFPDRQAQSTMFLADQPYSNAIRKAYICKASARSLKPGDILAFYRSDAPGAVVCLGVLERQIASNNPDTILRAVQGRTVFARGTIRQFCESSREVLVLRFRQVLREFEHIPLCDLIRNGALSAAPQSVTRIPEEAYGWLRTQTGT